MLDSATSPEARAQRATAQAPGALPQVEFLGDEDLRNAALSVSVTLVQGRLLLGRCLLEIHRRELWYQWGFSCLNHFVSLCLDMDAQEAKEARRVARALENLPALAEAAEAGRLRWGKLREVVRVATPDTDEAWLEAALRLPCRKLVRLVRRARQGGDAADEAEAREASRTRIELDMLPEEDELFRAAIAVLSAEAGRMLSPLEAVIDLCRQVVEGRLRTTPAQQRKTRELVEELQVLRSEQDQAELQALEAEGYTCTHQVAVEPAHALPAQEAEAADLEPTHEPQTPELAAEASGPAEQEPETAAEGYTCTLDGSSLAAEGAASPWELVDRAPATPWEAAAVRETPVPGAPGVLVASPARRPHWEPASQDVRARVPGESLRRWVFRRDAFQCACPDCPNTVWLQTHHIVFHCRGGLTVPSNVVLACAACHRNIHKGRLSVSGDAEKGLTWRDGRGRLLGAWSAGELDRAAQQAAAFLQERLAC